MPSKEYRQTVVSWGARTTPCPTYSQPSPEVISTSQIRLHKPTRAPWQWKLKSVVQRKGSPSPGPSWTVLGEPWPCCPDMKPIKSGQHKSTFWSWGTCVYGTHYGMQGKGILGLHKIYYGCLGEEPKVGERMDLGDLWRNNYGENKGVRRFKKKRKKGQLCKCSASLAMPCTWPILSVLLSILLQSISVDFSGWRTSCSVCGERLSSSSWSWTMVWGTVPGCQQLEGLVSGLKCHQWVGPQVTQACASMVPAAGVRAWVPATVLGPAARGSGYH